MCSSDLAQSDAFTANGCAAAIDLARWRHHVSQQWAGVRITHFEAEHGKASAHVELGSVGAANVSCELVHGPVDASGVILRPTVEPLGLVDDYGGSARFASSFVPTAAGSYGVTVRVRANHLSLTNPVETGLITWV